MKKQPVRKQPKSKKKTAALAVALLVAAAIGVWLYVSPMLEKGRLQETQDQLLSSIETGDGVIPLEKPVAGIVVDYYDPAPQPVASEEPASEPEPIFWTESDETEPTTDSGEAVIAGHRNYDYGSHFNRLGEIEVGDEIGYQPKDGGAMRFRVYEILEIIPGDQAAFEQPADKSIITLLTCTPIRTATHRLLVRADLISEGDSQ
ncbi:sortase [Ohessyouella blattaphilus]|uniref:Sortase n=1 Tax=Ohessyouella blattaphilus TaxID=2949333 RepID=A0ABT1EGQ6_9FIRM|nr:sortase [Ohessyouella blattaphilus]MCP1109701.1 sortase [Ohessyouella blattaphilus]MCR8563095.1 sortase [Ohessyouella blattaphilus]